ncbi:hypothetical protein M184_gp68 [Mycobacterium phage WIVsmall]|uniref:hypothetical protein n=1 Tax=Mycobacterium phage WIVsmall TaxID=1327036 RepID=UPI00032B31F8|nr:hypothetical protein M184_gp68 [Mycobacterium phage WIVsmall]AGK88198.1 hypothetical protein WIVsmall_68 [Mycobacterium phage WIVsmall]
MACSISGPFCATRNANHAGTATRDSAAEIPLADLSAVAGSPAKVVLTVERDCVNAVTPAIAFHAINAVTTSPTLIPIRSSISTTLDSASHRSCAVSTAPSNASLMSSLWATIHAFKSFNLSVTLLIDFANAPGPSVVSNGSPNKAEMKFAPTRPTAAFMFDKAPSTVSASFFDMPPNWPSIACTSMPNEIVPSCDIF